jgi:DUF2975 family protein
MKTIGTRSLSSFLTLLLNIGFYGTALGVVLMAFIAVVPLLFTNLRNVEMSIPVSFIVSGGEVDVAAPALGIARAELRDARGSGTLEFRPPNGAFLSTTAVLVILAFVFALWVLAQLRAVFRTLRDGHPFVPANARRIRSIGYAVIAGEIVRSAVAFGTNAYVTRHFVADGVSFDAWPDVNILAILCGLIIVVVAEVFREGTRLEESLSGISWSAPQASSTT